jgi:hypothetical protein
MNSEVRLTLILTALRWVALLGFLSYGIFAHESWAIVVGILIAIVGMIYSTMAFARRSSKIR